MNEKVKGSQMEPKSWVERLDDPNVTGHWLSKRPYLTRLLNAISFQPI